MTPFSGVTFLCVVLLRFLFYAFIEDAALRSTFLICRRPDSHTCFFYFSFCLFVDVYRLYACMVITYSRVWINRVRAALDLKYRRFHINSIIVK